MRSLPHRSLLLGRSEEYSERLSHVAHQRCGGRQRSKRFRALSWKLQTQTENEDDTELQRPALLAVRAIAMVAELMRLFQQRLSWLPTPFKNRLLLLFFNSSSDGLTGWLEPFCKPYCFLVALFTTLLNSVVVWTAQGCSLTSLLLGTQPAATHGHNHPFLPLV